MGSLLDMAVLIEATMLSILLALWVTWLGLRGLFLLMPGTSFEAASIRNVARRAAESPSHNVA